MQAKTQNEVMSMQKTYEKENTRGLLSNKASSEKTHVHSRLGEQT